MPYQLNADLPLKQILKHIDLQTFRRQLFMNNMLAFASWRSNAGLFVLAVDRFQKMNIKEYRPTASGDLIQRLSVDANNLKKVVPKFFQEHAGMTEAQINQAANLASKSVDMMGHEDAK